MAIIHLTKGYRATVDDDLFDELNSYSWYASGTDGRAARRLRAGPRKLIYMYHQVLHVLPWVLSANGFNIDHIDNDPTNNCLDNLRVVSIRDNNRNRQIPRVGVAYDGTHDRYKAYIDQFDKPRINVGTYLTWDDAELALNQAKMELGLADN